MHGTVHDFVVANTVKDWKTRPTGHGGGALIPSLTDLDLPEMKEQKVFANVLDIGSLNINGSMKDYDFCGAGPKWKELIGMQNFAGVDLVAGGDVTDVYDAHKIYEIFQANSFDLVMCLEMLEHDSDPQETLLQAYRALKPGGLLLITTVDQNAPEHMQDHPVEVPYNHITEEQFKQWLLGVESKSWNYWHIESDLMARIEK